MQPAAFLARFGAHSVGGGGASAVANADIPLAIWGHHGGWRSTSSPLRYMGMDETHVMSVTRAIMFLARDDEGFNVSLH
jgi:hypothetical protein